MKTIKFLSALMLMLSVTVLTGCHKVKAPKVTTAQPNHVTATTCMAGGEVTDDGRGVVVERGVCWGTDAKPTVSGDHLASGTTGTGSFSCQIMGLTDNTTYYVRAYAINDAGTGYGEAVSFTTLASGGGDEDEDPEDVPVVTTGEVSNVTQTSAIGAGIVTSDNGAEVIERGVCWSTEALPTLEDSHTAAAIAGTGAFTCQITGLTAETTYYLRAYAVNGNGTGYGEVKTFTTQAGGGGGDVPTATPGVITGEVEKVAQTSAWVNGEVTDDGGGTILERGICYGTAGNPNISGSHVTASSAGTGAFVCPLAELAEGTTYHVRAYAKNELGISYGDDVTFTTLLSVNLPTVTTSNVSDITAISANGGGIVTDDGGAEIRERGLCWSTGSDPTVSDSHIAAATSGIGTFSCAMTGLTPNTTYHVRAYAINSKGTAYGREVTFTTLSLSSLPKVTTSDVTNITANSALGGGNVTDDGGSEIKERGLCYGTTPNPTMSDNVVQASIGGTGIFVCPMEGLKSGATYYVRAYAINGAGTAYGEQKSFRTLN